MFNARNQVFRAVVGLNIFLIAVIGAHGAVSRDKISRERIEAIAGMLPVEPRGPGEPIGQRKFWASIAGDSDKAAQIRSAEKIAARPIQEQPDDLYLEYSRNGNRTNWQNVAKSRRSPLEDLVLAECFENKGRFLRAIQDRITTLCAERTWVLPAHDKGLTNFRGTSITIDLGSSALAWNLAMTDYLVGGSLPDEVRAVLRARLKERIVQPYLAMIRGERERDWWITGTNNWNAVCHAGVVGTALIECVSREERAEIIAAAEYYSKDFLSGFTPDGYCSEGLGYWNYGFGHFALLCETVRDATAGKIDWLVEMQQARQPAQFGSRIEIIHGVSPAFADCAVDAKPSPHVQWLLSRRLGDEREAPPPAMRGFLPQAVLYAIEATRKSSAHDKLERGNDESLRTWFDNAGVLICRPAIASKADFAVALKGGHNAEHHNHNDLGSYVVVSGGKPVLLDPGSEIYTARTFSSRRYDSKLLNSYGHSVPVVAGQLQRTGPKAEAKVLSTEFTTETDRLRMDIKSAYAVPELQKLEREFTYWRSGAGSLIVRDDVQLSSPKSFSTALVTLGKVTQVDETTLQVVDGAASVHVEIDAGSNEFDVVMEEIRENAKVKPTRIGINLREPVAAGTITLRITPTGKSSYSRENVSW